MAGLQIQEGLDKLNNMFKITRIILLILTGLSIKAQNHVDALRYSQESLWGSARYVSMGGAFGSLGANASTPSHNPAGIAINTNNEFSSSLSFLDIETSASYHSSNTFDNNSNRSVPNLNYVNANIFDPEQIGDWSRFNFGIGYNKLEDYNQNIYISSELNENNFSFSDFITTNSNGISFENLNMFSELLAFNTYLIDTLNSPNNYVSNANFTNRNQSFSSVQSGSKNEFYVSFGSAYQDRLFIGATIGFPSIEYTERNIIRESNADNSDGLSEQDSYEYNTNLFTSGSGINLKFGLIYKLDETIRYGFAIHTPTYYEMNEEYWTSMSTNLANAPGSFSDESYLGFFDYRLTTPFKMINSLSLVINKSAIISLDYELLDYSSSNFNSDFDNFTTSNTNIENYYTRTSNLKLGGELKIHPQLSLRGGYAYYGSPFALNYNDASQEYLTFGAGLNVNQYFFDMAIINMLSNYDTYIYEEASAAEIQLTKSQLIFSAGFKF